MRQRRARLITLIAASALAGAAAIPGPAQATTPAEVAGVRPAVTPTAEAGSARFERWATLSRTSRGYYYDAGQQDTHLVITRVEAGVRFADTRTDFVWSKPDACRSKRARVGSALVCPVPPAVNARRPMTVRVFTRLGDDHIDSSGLSAAFELHMLADAGRDIVRAGSGNDFINGAQGGDRVTGGPGKDWIRTGKGRDRISGGPGSDRLVGVNARDRIHGGKGNDRVGGGDGRDRLVAGKGKDFVLCGSGRDNVRAERGDRIMRNCEAVRYG